MTGVGTLYSFPLKDIRRNLPAFEGEEGMNTLKKILKKVLPKSMRETIKDIKVYIIKLTTIKKYIKYQFVPPGHFYSPIANIEEIMKEDIWSNIPRQLPAIDLNEKYQIDLMNFFSNEYYPQLPFKPEKQENLRYYYENPAYSYSDAIFLHCMIRHLKPKRIIEVGSGFSSCVMIDTNEIFFNNNINCTFIEPFPKLLVSLVKQEDKGRVKIISKRLQDVPLDVFRELQKNDILFIDSTHVSKVCSDVNYLFFNIIPFLSNGVYLHFHDILYPFEYPKDWIKDGISWNEAYMLRNFLSFNKHFDIAFFNTFMETFHYDWFLKNMPLCLKNTGGSIWIVKRAGFV